MRYFIQFSYFGTAYHGWQKQPNAITVQSVLTAAICKILRFEVVLMGAGRTDSGVHARQMFAHFDGNEITDLPDLCYRLNAYLPTDIAVQNIVRVGDEAHARFDANERTYEYWVIQNKDVFLMDRAHYLKHPLDVVAMNKAASILLLHIDFECFSKSNTDVYTYNCAISEAEWKLQNGVLVFTITADRFLRNMVRAVVGTLLDVGMGRTSFDDLHQILKSKDRNNAGVSSTGKRVIFDSGKISTKYLD